MTKTISTFIFTAALALARPASVNTLQDMEQRATQSVTQAELLQSYTQNQIVDADAHRLVLRDLKQNVNKMGVELASLESRRDSLDIAQQRALDAVLPLLRDSAANLQAATHFFNEHHSTLWAPEYRTFATRIAADSGQMATALRNVVKYEKTHEAEQKIEKVIGLETN